MNKFDYFFKACQAEEYRRRAWLVSAFSILNENPEAYKKDNYPYRLVQTPAGYFFIDPDRQGQLTMIADAKVGEPLFQFREHIDVKVGMVPNLTKDITTTYGNLLVNFIVLVFPFGHKFPYQEGRIDADALENIIAPRLRDTPKPEEPREDKYLYVDEYLKFTDAMFFLPVLSQLCVPTATKKTMTAAPGIVELKEKLLEQYKDQLTGEKVDPALVAKIQAELIQYDKDYMKGDLGEGFLIKGKQYNVVRSKLFGMHGGEAGLSEDINVELIRNSLSQGWDLAAFPAMNNSSRAGSFDRGAQTVLGGVKVKEIQRASSNIAITEADCGTTMGANFYCEGDNYKWLEGFSIVSDTGPQLVTNETAKNYVGQHLVVRSPQYCILPATDYCKTCCGERLSANPTAVSSALAEIGSIFLSTFMKSMHGKQLTIADMDYKKSII